MPVHRQAASEMGSDYESVLREIKQDEELASDVKMDKPDESISWFDLLYDLFANGILSINNINHCGTGSKREKGNSSISSRFVDPFLGSQNVEHAKKKAAYK